MNNVLFVEKVIRNSINSSGSFTIDAQASSEFRSQTATGSFRPITGRDGMCECAKSVQ